MQEITSLNMPREFCSQINISTRNTVFEMIVVGQVAKCYLFLPFCRRHFVLNVKYNRIITKNSYLLFCLKYFFPRSCATWYAYG